MIRPVASAFRRKTAIAVVASFIALAACEASSARPGGASRVLFVGNSLTATNNLPAVVDAVAAASGTPLASTAVAFPSLSLEDHWARGDALRAIDRGGWSFVVLQQGPSARLDSRVTLREYVRRFDERIRPTGARTVVYMVWPEAARRDAFDAVHDSYALAAQDVGAVLAPAGDLWRAAWRRDESLALYGGDRFHPSPLGSYLAALAIVHAITGRPVRVSALRSPVHAFPDIILEPRVAKLLEAVANE